jgi:hypothetical protein
MVVRALREIGRLARLVLLFVPLLASPAAAETPYGVFYERHEPTFYTGFAPRSVEPERVHVHMGRGNQLRVTVVLSDDVIASYASDLEARERTFQDLIESGDVQPTQNAAFAAFESTLRTVTSDGASTDLAPERLRERNLALLERLNPGRVFRIRMAIDEVVGRWIAAVARASGREADDPATLLNAMLPTRLFLDASGLDRATTQELAALVARARSLSAEGRSDAAAALRADWMKLFSRVTQGRYPQRGDALEFVEFTALYPIGTANAFAVVDGRRIPLSPTPGRRRFTTHQRSLTVDHIADAPSYSWSPWLPYMHVGPKLHNAFHTPYWVLDLDSASFLPAALRSAIPRDTDGQTYRYAYYLSRGPASHGCTHVNPGHLVELRHLLPVDAETLGRVEVFINPSPLFDVFDIDGDFAPEVMGVRYFVAYSIVNDRPGRMYAPVERAAYYDWLYGGALRLDDRGASFAGVRDARFVGERAEDGSLYDRIPLYEAPYEPERIQFYGAKPISFVRELRNVGAHHPFSKTRAERAL